MLLSSIYQSIRRVASTTSFRTIHEAIGDKNRLIVDVRTVEEVARGGGCEGSLNIPLDQLSRRVGELGSDKSKPIIFYCAKGVRSADAVAFANSLGFENVFNGVNGRQVKRLLETAS